MEVIHHRVSHIDYDDDDDEPNPYDILHEPEVKLDTTFSNVVVVDHVPVTTEDKFTKLRSIIAKLFSQLGELAEDGVYLPLDEETKQTKGFAFIEYANKKDADSAVLQMDGHKLDKAHVFRVCHFDDFKRYEQVPAEYSPPAVKAEQDKEDLDDWLFDESAIKGIDQFVVRQGDLTEVYVNTPPDFKSIKATPGWTETYVVWSPLGTYIATFHRKGIQLWGGHNFRILTRLEHPGARLIEFSPSENYIVTFSPQFAENDDPKDPKCVIVWNVKTGAKMRGFTSTSAPQWPIFQWSHDDKYFARMGEDVISVYETPSMGLIDKQSIKIPGVKDFSWSPSQNVISYFVPETSNVPAKVVLLNIPSKRELRQKNLFNVSDCKLHWQAAGRYLCVKVDRQKSKKTTVVNFELFRMKEKAVPIESLELSDPVHAFAWEPRGDRFAVIHGESVNRADVSFYSLADKSLKKIVTLEKRPANSLFWSPAGDYIVLAGLRNLNGVLEFYSVKDTETLENTEHNMCTNIEWDPSGRFVVTYVSHWRHQIDTGFKMFSFAGKLMSHVVKDRFYQLLWRPRPPSLITEELQKKIEVNYPELARRYLKEDKAVIKAAERARNLAQEEARRAFNKQVAEREKEYALWRKEFAKTSGRDLDAEERDAEYVEEVEEELVSYNESFV